MKLIRAEEFEYIARAGGHWLHSSVPAFGGEDVAPNPIDYVVFGLGACSSAFIENWCWENNLDPAGLEVNVEYSKDKTGLHDFKLTVDLPWVDTTMRWRDVIKAIRNCPVHKTLKDRAIEVEVVR